SPAAISAATEAALWYVDHTGSIGQLKGPEIQRQRTRDPEAFLARATVVAEGATEKGFVSALLERALGSTLEQHGIHVTNADGHESALGLLEALADGGLLFGGFCDEEGKHPTRWSKVQTTLKDLLFRWQSGSTEANLLGIVPDEKVQVFIADP